MAGVDLCAHHHAQSPGLRVLGHRAGLTRHDHGRQRQLEPPRRGQRAVHGRLRPVREEHGELHPLVRDRDAGRGRDDLLGLLLIAAPRGSGTMFAGLRTAARTIEAPRPIVASGRRRSVAMPIPGRMPAAAPAGKRSRRSPEGPALPSSRSPDALQEAAPSADPDFSLCVDLFRIVGMQLLPPPDPSPPGRPAARRRLPPGDRCGCGAGGGTEAERNGPSQPSLCAPRRAAGSSSSPPARAVDRDGLEPQPFRLAGGGPACLYAG